VISKEIMLGGYPKMGIEEFLAPLHLSLKYNEYIRVISFLFLYF